MKKTILSFFLLLALFCGCEKKSGRTIAILMPVSHPSMEQIEKGFKETVEAAGREKYHFSIYNAQGNKTLMRSEIEEIIRLQPAIVVTLGTTATHMSVEAFNKKAVKLPVVFTAVNDPIGFNIVASEEHPAGLVTGVKELLAFDAELDALQRYKTHLNNVMLVYNPMEPGLQKDRLAIEALLNAKGINLKAVEVFQTNEMLAKVSPFIEQTDAVLVLKDNTVITGLDLLIKLAERQHIPIMASDLDSPKKGAAFGYGVYEYDFGVEAAKKALQILEEQTHPGDIAVTAPSSTL